MLSSFITGSQTEAHKLRMLKEAVKFLIRITCFSLLLFTVIFFYRVDKNVLNLATTYFKADIAYTAFKDKGSPVQVKDRFGKVRKILPSLILKNPIYKRSAERLVSEYLSYLLYSLAIPLLVPLWFFWQGKKKGASKLLRGAVLESSKVVKILVSKYNNKILERGIWRIKTLFRLIKSKILKTKFKEINYKPYINFKGYVLANG